MADDAPTDKEQELVVAKEAAEEEKEEETSVPVPVAQAAEEDPQPNDEVDRKISKSLASVYGRSASVIMLVGLLINTAMLLYSHLGVSAQIKLSLEEGEEFQVDLEGACANFDDQDAINANAQIRDQLNVVAFQQGIDCVGDPRGDVLCFEEDFGEANDISADCTACVTQFASCMQIRCLTAECRLNGGGTNQEICEICVDQECEFELEVCTGFNFFQDEDTDACLGDDEPTVLVAGNDFFDNLPLRVATETATCAADEEASDSCLRQALFDTFDFSDDCLLCMDDHASCIAEACSTECASGNITTCESCVEGSSCGADFNTCSGVARYNVARSLVSVDDSSTRSRKLQQQLTFEGTCLVKDFPLFDTLALTFVESVEKAAQGGSIGLALLIGIASGVWPYTKNILMFLTWFVPLNRRFRGKILKTLAILGTWSLVDVFAVVLIANGTLIQKQLLSGLPFVLFVEPRPGIYFFGLAALWAIAQGEIIRYYDAKHHKKTDIMKEKEAPLSPTFAELKSFQKKKGLLAFLSIISLFATVFAVSLPNLEMELQGKITNGNGADNYQYNIFQLGAELFSKCSLHDGHESVFGAYFLGILFIVLVVVVPVLASFFMFLAASKMTLTDMTPKKLRLVNISFVSGNFASIDVWVVTLFVFSNQFAGLIRGSVGEENNCGLSAEEEANGEICVGLEGKVGIGGMVLVFATFIFWVSQCLLVSMMNATKKYSE